MPTNIQIENLKKICDTPECKVHALENINLKRYREKNAEKPLSRNRDVQLFSHFDRLVPYTFLYGNSLAQDVSADDAI